MWIVIRIVIKRAVLNSYSISNARQIGSSIIMVVHVVCLLTVMSQLQNHTHNKIQII